ncbi:flagellar biosynthesis protein FlhF [Spirochaetia bacterium]|nr:flagellar biosynthesis protein FlhF [Spirochaetia bacterium]
MPSFTEQGRTRSECMEKVRALYGKDARVLEERTIQKGGFLGLGSHTEVEMTGFYGYAPAGMENYGIRPASAARPVETDLETVKRQVLAAAGKTMPEAAIQRVLKELDSLGASVRDLNKKVDAGLGTGTNGSDHPSLQKLEEDLLANDFSSSFIQSILERVRREFPLDELTDYEEVQKRVVLWIGEQITIYREPEIVPQAKKKPRIIVLVGPTGVGKTTTLVKLAALYGELAEGLWKKQVRLITLDCYRLGAEYQLKKYGEIMQVPVTSVDSFDGLKQVLALYRQDVDFILVDTSGKSPRNYADLGDMKAILDACPPKTEVHLCLQAATKSGDIREILKQFEPFKYKSLVITKLDETGGVGNVISALAEEKKCVSFITTGQGVPWDIERAAAIRFLMNLEGFTVDRLALVDHFSSRGV